MHNGMLELDAQKMSKSLGNVATLRSALDTWGRGPLLVYFMSGHWRKPIDFSPDALADARTTWGTLRTVDAVTAPRAAPSWDDFTRVLNDDFNTPEALAILLEWRAAGQRALLERGLDVFGLRIEVIRDRGVVLARAEVSGAAHMARPVTPQRVYQLARSYAHARSARDVQRYTTLRRELVRRGWKVHEPPAKVLRLAEKRADARERGDYATADAIREQIREEGWIIEDTRDRLRFRLVKG